MLPTVNRCAITLHPKQPYIDWANGLEEGGPKLSLDDQDPDSITIFLGPDLEETAAIERWLRKNRDLFFEEMLEEWCTDPDLWPKRRTWKAFNDWFTVRIHTVVADTVDTPLETE